MVHKKRPGPLFQNIDLPVDEDVLGLMIAAIRNVLGDVNSSKTAATKKQEQKIDDKLKSFVSIYELRRAFRTEKEPDLRPNGAKFRDIKHLETQIESLYKEMIRLKMDVAHTPALLKSSYTVFKMVFLEICSGQIEFEKQKLYLPEKSQNQLRNVAILCQMMELNACVRSFGCVSSMRLLPASQTKESEALYRQTKLGFYLEKVEVFEELSLYTCYGCSGDVDFEDAHTREHIKAAKGHFFKVLHETMDLYAESSALGELFRERMDALAHCVNDLEVAMLNHFRLKDLENASVFFESCADDGAKPRHAFHEAISHYENLQNPRHGGMPNYNRTRTWRKETRVLADEGLQMCLSPETNENVKKMVTTTSRGIKEKLCKQATILVLEAISMCCDGQYPGAKTLEKFNSIYGVLRGNADHIEEMLRLLIPRMKNPEWEVLSLTEEQYDYIMATHGFLYQDIMYDVQKVAFFILPEAQRPHRMVTAIEEWDKRMRAAWKDEAKRDAFEHLLKSEGEVD